MMGLGAFPALTLADARCLRADYLSLLANGIDPQMQAEQVTEQQQIALDSIFSTVAANWFSLKQASVTPDYAKDIWRIAPPGDPALPGNHPGERARPAAEGKDTG